MRINVNHCIVVKAGNGFRNLMPADGPHEVDDAVAAELIEAKAATAVEAKGEAKSEQKAEAKPKGSKHP
jgi:hypothetical protein